MHQHHATRGGNVLLIPSTMTEGCYTPVDQNFQSCITAMDCNMSTSRPLRLQ